MKENYTYRFISKILLALLLINQLGLDTLLVSVTDDGMQYAQIELSGTAEISQEVETADSQTDDQFPSTKIIANNKMDAGISKKSYTRPAIPLHHNDISTPPPQVDLQFS